MEFYNYMVHSMDGELIVRLYAEWQSMAQCPEGDQ